MFSLLRELKEILAHLKTRYGFLEGLPVLVVLALAFLTSMVPVTIYQTKTAFFIGQYSFNYLEILAPFLMLPVFLQVKKSKLMLSFAVFFLFLGFATIPLAVSSPINAFCVGFYTAIPFLYVSCIRFTPFQKDLLKWGVLILCFGIIAQVFIYGLGFKTYVSGYTGEQLGVYGEVSRVNSTVAAATGTSVYIFMASILSSLLFIRRPLAFWLILIISLLAIAVSQSRGASIMMLLYLVALGFPMMREAGFISSGFFLRILTIGCVITALIGFLFVKPELVEEWRQRVDYFRGNAFDDAGRNWRYKEAYDNFSNTSGLGVGLGNYSPRKKMMPFPQGVVGRSSPHNVYLLLLAETGAVGLIGYLVLISLVMRLAWKHQRRMILIALLIIFFIGHNLEFVYLHIPYLWLYALILGYACHQQLTPLPMDRE